MNLHDESSSNRGTRIKHLFLTFILYISSTRLLVVCEDTYVTSVGIQPPNYSPQHSRHHQHDHLKTPSILLNDEPSISETLSQSTPTASEISDGRPNGDGGYHVSPYDIHIDEARSRFVSTTLSMDLTPFTHELSKNETKVYENGLYKFLVERFATDPRESQGYRGLIMLDVVVISHHFVPQKEMHQQTEKAISSRIVDRVMRVEVVVSAENAAVGPKLSSDAFADAVVMGSV